MNTIFSPNFFVILILAFSIISGQFIKIPVSGFNGPVLLDFAVAILNLILLIKLRLQLKKPNLFLNLGLLFSAIAFLSLILTPLKLNLLEFIASFFYIARFFNYILFGWLIYCDFLKKSKNEIFWVIILSSLGLVILGLLQFFFLPNLLFLTDDRWDPHYYRTVSTFLDPNFLGAFLVMSMLIAISNNQRFIKKYLFVVFFALCFFALLTTFSRSSYLMFAVSLATYSLLKRSLKMFLYTLILTALLMLSFYIYTQVISKPRNIDRNQSASFRISTWQEGFKLFQSSPILGVGFNSYRFALKQYKLVPDSFLESRGSSTNDSSLLYVLATTGLIGVITFVLFLASLAKLAFDNIRKNGVSGAVLFASLLGLIVHSFFNNSLFYPPIFFLLILIATETIPKK